MKGEMRLGELATIESGFAFKSSDWMTEGNPVVKIKNVKDGFVSLDDCAFVPDEVAAKASRFLAREGDILVSLTGYVGQVGRVSKGDAVLVNQRVGLVRPRDESEKSFVYHLLRSLRTKIEELGTGTAQANVAPRDIMNLPVRTIENSSRRTIGMLLDYFDSKIGLNNRTCLVLEEIAQAIFNSWFIDFHPVKAKMAGEKPVGMDDATAALFPDSMEDSELGPIPKGWSKLSMGNFVQARRGKVITKSKTIEGPIPVIAGGLEPAYFHNVANVSWPAVTVSASGANAGFVRLNLEDIWASDCSFISKGETEFVYTCYLFLKVQQEIVFAMQQGGAQPHIYPSDLSRLTFHVPGDLRIFERFEQLVAVIFQNVRSLDNQTRTLTAVRDALLPRLISGELQIPEELLAS